MSTVLNINTESIETMKTRDALKIINRLLEWKREYRVQICNYIEYADVEHEKMVNIDVTVQVFKDPETQERYIYRTSRAKDFSCSNSYTSKKLSSADFHKELEFQFRFNEPTKKEIK